MSDQNVSRAQDAGAQPIAWRVHYCGQWLYFDTEAACEVYCHDNNKAEPLYQSQAKEPEASGGLCTDAPHAVRVGEPARAGTLSWPALGRTSNVSELGVTAGETAPNSDCLSPAEGEDHFHEVLTSIKAELDSAEREVKELREMVERRDAQVESANAREAANEKRWQLVYDMVYQARECVRLKIVYDARPPGLFQALQDAVHAISGREVSNV